MYVCIFKWALPRIVSAVTGMNESRQNHDIADGLFDGMSLGGRRHAHARVENLVKSSGIQLPLNPPSPAIPQINHGTRSAYMHTIHTHYRGSGEQF